MDGTCRRTCSPLRTISECGRSLWLIISSSDSVSPSGPSLRSGGPRKVRIPLQRRHSTRGKLSATCPGLRSGQKNCCAGVRWNLSWPLPSQGIARSRDDAANLKAQFIEWIERQPDMAAEGEELIDPRNFLKCSRSRPPAVPAQPAARIVDADLSGTDGNLGRYAVIPLRKNGGLRWIDPAGYELAASQEWQGMLVV